LRIKIVVPAATDYFNEKVVEDFGKVVRPDTELSSVNVKRGPFRIESAYDETFGVPFALEEMKKAEEEGYDAIVIFCAGDPGLQAAKELLTVPVVGLLESAAHLAAMLGNKFSILTPVKTGETFARERLRIYRLEDRLASIRAIDIPVADLEKDIDVLKERLLELGRKCVDEDGADVIIYGCGGIRGLNEWLQTQLGVPVIEPGLVAVRTAEMLVDLKLAQSKKTYMKPLPKKIYLYESYK
jgi:allantoin racemase